MRAKTPLPPGRSGFPFLGETIPFLKDGFAFIEERARRHGPVFRTRILGRPTAVIVGPEACSTWIDPERIARAGAQPGFLFELLAGPSLPHLDGKEHRDRRAVLLEAFTPEALDAYVPRLGRVIEGALERWAAAGELRLIPELKRLAVEGICGNFMGLEPGETLRGVVGDYDTLLKGIGGIPFALPGTAFKRALGARDRLLSLYEDVIRRHRENASDDGLARILAASAEGGYRIDDDALKRELHHIVIAGYIVFAEIASLLLKLEADPGLREGLLQELTRGLGSEPLSRERLGALDLLTRTVLEVKRVTPVVPAFFGIAKSDFELHGARVPRGWLVLWSPYASMMEGGIYEDPKRFDPGRLASPRSEHQRHEHAFVPQGAGSRERSHRCPGEDYATLFMQVFLVALLRGGFRWSFPKQRLEYDMSLTPPEPKDGALASVSRG